MPGSTQAKLAKAFDAEEALQPATVSSWGKHDGAKAPATSPVAGLRPIFRDTAIP